MSNGNCVIRDFIYFKHEDIEFIGLTYETNSKIQLVRMDDQKIVFNDCIGEGSQKIQYLKAEQEKTFFNENKHKRDKGVLITASKLGQIQVVDIIDPTSDQVKLDVVQKYEQKSGIMTMEISPHYNRASYYEEKDEIEEEFLATGSELGKIYLFKVCDLKSMVQNKQDQN